MMLEIQTGSDDEPGVGIYTTNEASEGNIGWITAGKNIGRDGTKLVLLARQGKQGLLKAFNDLIITDK